MAIPILISLGLFAALMAAISYFGYRRYARPARVFQQLGGQAAFPMPSIDRVDDRARRLAVWRDRAVGREDPGQSGRSHRDSQRFDRGRISLRQRALPIYLGLRVVACRGAGATGAGPPPHPHVESDPVDRDAGGGGIRRLFRSQLRSGQHDRAAAGAHANMRCRTHWICWWCPSKSGLGLDQAMQYVARELWRSSTRTWAMSSNWSIWRFAPASGARKRCAAWPSAPARRS